MKGASIFGREGANEWAIMTPTERKVTEGRSLSELYQLWDHLRNVPVSEDGLSEERFEHFEQGTHYEVIYRWFESQNPRFIVGEVMQGIRHADETGKVSEPSEHEQSLERAGNEGRIAYGKGVSIKDNPYPEADPRHEFWSGGWEDGMYAAPSQADMNDAGSREKESERFDRKVVWSYAVDDQQGAVLVTRSDGATLLFQGNDAEEIRSKIDQVRVSDPDCASLFNQYSDAEAFKSDETGKMVDDGFTGQDRESYSDDQDRESYSVAPDRKVSDIRLDWHFADNAERPFVGVFVTTRQAFEDGELPDNDDVVQVVVNVRDRVTCDLVQDAATFACQAVNATQLTSAEQALAAAAAALTASGKAANPAVHELVSKFEDASRQLAVASQQLALTSRALAEQYPAKGSMPRSVVHQLYQLREDEVAALSKQEVITVAQLSGLDRGARTAVASLLFTKCDESARDALLHDEHHIVRSAAVLSQEDISTKRPRSGTSLGM